MGGELHEVPFFSVAEAVALTPFFATWVMPNAAFVPIYLVATIAAFFGAGFVSSTLFPITDTTELRCGLPMLGALFLACVGLVTGIGGRVIGLLMAGGGRTGGVGVYFIQLTPFFAGIALLLCGSIR